jgi:hypothetical protein
MPEGPHRLRAVPRILPTTPRRRAADAGPVHPRFIIKPHYSASKRGSEERANNHFGRARSKDVTAHKKPIDHRPFRSKAEHLLEGHLEAQYRGLAIPDLVAALEPLKDRSDRRRNAKTLPAR